MVSPDSGDFVPVGDEIAFFSDNCGVRTVYFQAFKIMDNQLIDTFLNAQWPSIGKPKDLAERMAKLAQLIRDVIKRAFGNEPGQGKLHQQMEGFRDVLLHDLTEDQLAL